MNTTQEQIEQEHAELERQLADPDAAADASRYAQRTKRYAELHAVVEQFQQLERVERERAEAQETRNATDDTDLQQLADEEISRLTKQQHALTEAIDAYLNPADPLDVKDIIVEIRAGAGGDEAGLFAADLYRMYVQYAEAKGYTPRLLSANRSGIGGFKDVSFEIVGRGAYSMFKYESGVHRVQRIPETEKSGRVHTSTVTVAVLPEAEEQDIEIKPSDLRIDVFRSSGHGGQSVNTTDSAVRITHLPTNTVVTCQDEKSQHKNRDKAMRVLRARLLAQQAAAEQAKRSAERRSQIGTGDRSEKIRTYNYPQDRITDHRIKQNFSNLQGVLDGDLDRLVDALRTADHAQSDEA